MLGILDLLNSDEPSDSNPPQTEPKSPLIECQAPSKPYQPSQRPSRLLPRSKVHPSLLKDKKLVDIALRHKSGSKRQGSHYSADLGSSKLHLKSLEAGLRVRLIMCPSIYELFRQLTPHTSRRNCLYHVGYDEDKQCLQGTDISDELKDAMVHKSRKSASNSTPASASSYSNGFSPSNPSTSISDSSAGATPLYSETNGSSNGSNGTGPYDPNGEGDNGMGYYNGNGLNNGIKNDINNEIRNDINNGIKNGVASSYGDSARLDSNSDTADGSDNLTPNPSDSSKSASSGNSNSSSGSENSPGNGSDYAETDIKKEPSEDGSEISSASSSGISDSVSRSSSSSGSSYNGYFEYSNPQSHHQLLGTSPVGSSKSVLKRVRLIDNNLVNLAGVSRKVLKSFQMSPDKVAPPTPVLMSDGPESDDSRGILTTFNLLDTAVTSLFGTKTYSVVRVTRSSSSTSDGSVLLKLECAKPGDCRLIDDKEFLEDMAASIGKPGQTPNNLFIKKVVARPRYKSDMKIYIVPTSKKVLLYVDKRDFERDLINGVIDIDFPPDRFVYTTFPVDDILNNVRDLVSKSSSLGDADTGISVPNHMTGPTGLRHLNGSSRWPLSNDSDMFAMSTSSLSLPSLTSNTGLTTTSGSVSSGSDPSSESTPGAADRSKIGIQSIPNAKLFLAEEPGELQFDTSYVA